MSTVAKILVVVNLVLAGAFLASASNFLGHQENWRRKWDALDVETKKDISQLMEQNKAHVEEFDRLDTQTRDIQTSNEGLRKSNNAVNSENDMLKQSWTETSSQLTRATAALQKSQNTIDSNRTLIDGLQQERTSLKEALKSALDQREAAIRSLNEKEVQFENLLANKQTLEERIESLKNENRSLRLSAENAIAKLGGSGDTPLDQPDFLGQIIAVAPEGDLAIISLGAEDGVKRGHRLTVSRGNSFVGELEITRVEAKQAAGRISKAFAKGKVQRGDRVMSAR